eukprot:16608-Heterococcus_DN1.PRE.2
MCLSATAVSYVQLQKARELGLALPADIAAVVDSNCHQSLATPATAVLAPVTSPTALHISNQNIDDAASSIRLVHRAPVLQQQQQQLAAQNPYRRQQRQAVPTAAVAAERRPRRKRATSTSSSSSSTAQVCSPHTAGNVRGTSAQALSRHSVARHARTAAVAEAKQQQPPQQQRLHNDTHSELLHSQPLSSLQQQQLQQQQQAQLSESKRCDAKLDSGALRSSSEHTSRFSVNTAGVHDCYSDGSHSRSTSAPVTPVGSKKPGIRDLQQIMRSSSTLLNSSDISLHERHDEHYAECDAKAVDETQTDYCDDWESYDDSNSNDCDSSDNSSVDSTVRNTSDKTTRDSDSSNDSSKVLQNGSSPTHGDTACLLDLSVLATDCTTDNNSASMHKQHCNDIITQLDTEVRHYTNKLSASVCGALGFSSLTWYATAPQVQALISDNGLHTLAAQLRS